jgi:hypothetical protein
VLKGAIGMEEGATVGKRVGSDVEDAHDESPFAGGESPGAELPGGWWAVNESHTGTMLHSSDNAVR